MRIDLGDIYRIVVAVDPAVTCHETSSETGIVVAGMHRKRFFVVLEDASDRLPPEQWGPLVVSRYQTWNANYVVAEVNQGGDLVKNLLKSLDPTLTYFALRAIKGKYLRALPVALLYEQGRVLHAEKFPELEKQMFQCHEGWESAADRLDALVWALTTLREEQIKEEAFC